MDNKKFILIFSLILSLCIFSAGCISGDGINDDEKNKVIITEETENSVSLESGKDILVSFMDKAAGYAKENGKEKALKAFNDNNGEFIDGNLYIYAYDFNGTLIAHPYQPELVGTDRLNWTTANGLQFVKASSDAARNGEGYVMYMYPSPGKSGEINESASDLYEPKIGYVKKIDDEWWIGSGIYLSEYIDKANNKMPEVIQDEIDFTNNAVEFAKENGREKALAEISNTSGKFVQGNLYIYAYDFNGTLLAHPYLTDKTGKNLNEKTGPYGVRSVEVLSKKAKLGGGYVIFGWENPSNDNKPELKLGYVKPVDENWWLGTGVYMSDLTR
ncbi:calcium:proton antiporter [Methanoplanus sp. FWC-SCC4]|uniref:Calcium:proton antiporter n=1 Tax=Methanochimaera problematica TaxID=2609417 RepID=A0AA97FAQ1_9EURY|nr:cache domain-containing protein [Methanoplanus sp. FWC-SCC4]WOF15667.1 calcium:proton antiporter [Methanoplanus sp. FWC-SCC4]